MKNFFFCISLIISLLMVSCSESNDTSFIPCGQYYKLTVNHDTYYAKLQKNCSDTLEGEYFKFDNQITAELLPFTCVIKKNICHIIAENQSFKVKLSHIEKKDREVSGMFKVSRRWRGKFEAVLYTEPKFVKISGDRYKKSMFDVVKISDVKYAQAKGYWDSYPDQNENYFDVVRNGLKRSLVRRDIDLGMDIYLPKNDSVGPRPLLMLIHGGGFYIGNKDAKHMTIMSNYFASQGYVVASIDYRLGFKPTRNAVERAGYQAVQDAHAAMRFLVANRELYNIDTNLLFVGGTSAGSITSLNLCFMTEETRPKATRGNILVEDLGTIESCGNDLKNTFHIRAVANMWGAVHDIKMIRNCGISIVSFHGDADNVVPYDYDYPFRDFGNGLNEMFFEKMYGSSIITDKAKTLGVNAVLYTYPGCGHSLYQDENGQISDRLANIEERISKFFYNMIIPNPIRIEKQDTQLWYAVNRHDCSELYWKVNGGLLLEIAPNQAKIIWLNSAPKHEITVSGKYKNGVGFYSTQRF